MAKKKTSEIEGFLTGDHQCSLLFPEEDATSLSIAELRENGLYLRDLIPEDAQEGKHKFKITVEAEPIDDENT